MDDIRAIDKTTDVETALAPLRSGSRILVGGFGERGFPFGLNAGLLAMGIGDLHLVKLDGNEDGIGIGLLVEAGRVARITASHIGLNRGLGQKINDGAIEAEICPQGVLAERIRAGGAGLGGVLSDIGIETRVGEGKQRVSVDGRDFLVEPAIRGDVALVRAVRADRFGNLVFRHAARNSNPLVAMAADYVVAEAGELVESGGLGAVQKEGEILIRRVIYKASPVRLIAEGSDATESVERVNLNDIWILGPVKGAVRRLAS